MSRYLVLYQVTQKKVDCLVILANSFSEAETKVLKRYSGGEIAQITVYN